MVSFSYVPAKLRNAVPDFVRTTEFTGFKLGNQDHILYGGFFKINIYF